MMDQKGDRFIFLGVVTWLTVDGREQFYIFGYFAYDLNYNWGNYTHRVFLSLF